MKSNTFSEKSMILFSFSLLIIMIAMFLWLWFGSNRPSDEAFRSTEDLSPVSIVGLESRTKTLFEGLKNNSGIPIPEPVGKEGRVDPFADL